MKISVSRKLNLVIAANTAFRSNCNTNRKVSTASSISLQFDRTLETALPA
jgi:hypothetical protein